MKWRLKSRRRQPLLLNSRGPNPLRADPSRTATLRRAFRAGLFRLLARLRMELVRQILTIEGDPRPPAELIRAKAGWFRDRATELFLARAHRPWFMKYLEAAYLKGLSRAHDDVHRKTAYRRGEREGAKRQFLSSVLSRRYPVTVNVFCPTGEGGGVDPSCSPSVGVDSNHTYSTSFHVGGKEFTFVARSDGSQSSEWDVVFFPGKLESGGDVKMTHDRDVSPVQVLRNVQQSLHSFIQAKSPKVLIFTATNLEPSRKIFYDRVSREIERHYGYSPTIWEDPEKTGSRYYALAKGELPAWLTKQREDLGLPTLPVANARHAVRDVGGKFMSHRMQTMSARLENELAGATAAMAQAVARELLLGLDKGWKPSTIAKNLAFVIDGLGRKRARAIAETEVVRAQAEGQLDGLEELGVGGVTMAVEFTAADNACPTCSSFDGAEMGLDEARGVIPVHPFCRCAWVPVLDRPTVNHGLPVRNVFCPTGKGGGVDPSCSPDAGSADKSKFVGEKVGKEEHARAGEIERAVAAAVGGVWEEDNAAYDVVRGRQGFEVKSLLKGSANVISVHPDALLRKVDWVAAGAGRSFHTVVIDDRKTYQGGAHAEKFSGHEVYYRRGSGRYSLGTMHKVASMEELDRLTRLPESRLPEKARGTLPSGEALARLREEAAKAHGARLLKDRTRKARLRAERERSTGGDA